MLEYEFEEVDCGEGGGGWSPLGGFGMETVAHQEAIRRRAAEGWRYVGFIPRYQRAGGFIEPLDRVFERRRPDT